MPNLDDSDNEGLYKLKSLNEKRYFMPATLLNHPLNPSKVIRLSKKDKKLYNLQKSKYEVTMKAWSKKPIHPSKHLFNLEEARLLIDGKYHADEEEPDDMDPAYAAAKDTATNQVLNRTVVTAKAEDIKKEIKLENFSKNAIIREMNKASAE